MHVDAAFPCSLYVAGDEREGGWSLDMVHSSPMRVATLTSAEEYCANFPRIDQASEGQLDVGWYC